MVDGGNTKYIHLNFSHNTKYANSENRLVLGCLTMFSAVGISTEV